MIQKKNRGVTLVEVLIALAVFMLLLAPLVTSLITSIKTTDSGKELQSRNDYAQVLMEKVKNAPIDDLKDSGKVAKYFEGSENVDVKLTKSSKYPESDDFTITGTTYLGTKKTKYSYKIQSVYEKKTDSYGIMEDLDPYKAAFVPVTFSNYDDVATEAIVTEKLKDKSNADSTIFAKKDDVASLRNSVANREVVIKMSGSKASGFTVKCELTYSESGKSITYEPYNQKFKHVPNIYLMYNAGVYNNMNTKDSITYDLSGVNFAGFDDKERINAFIIRTSKDYGDIIENFKNEDGSYDNTRFDELTSILSTDLKDVISNNKQQIEVSGTSSTRLYKESSSGSRDYNVTVSGGSSVPRDHFRVYHNLYYTDGSGEHDLVTAGANISDNLDSLKDAHEEIWSVYNVRLWMQEGDSVNDSDEMVTLQGTRGGGEIE